MDSQRIQTGSVQSSVTAKQLPHIRYEILTIFPTVRGSGDFNGFGSGGIWIGSSDAVTIPSGGGDSITDGFYLDDYLALVLNRPGNMDELWLIGTDTDDFITYLVQA